MDILELEGLSKIKYSLDGTNSWLDTEERITEHEERPSKIDLNMNITYQFVGVELK